MTPGLRSPPLVCQPREVPFMTAPTRPVFPPTSTSQEVRMPNVTVRRALTLAAAAAFVACASAKEPPPAMQQSVSSGPSPTLTAEERAAGWRPLVQGNSLAGGHVYHGGAPPGWAAAHGTHERGG